MRQDAGETLEVSHLELLRRASTQGDLQAWEAFQESLEETLLTWLHKHPWYEMVHSIQSDNYFIALSFERMWEAVVQGQIVCGMLSDVLVYLLASLNGVILETVRVTKRTEEVSGLWPDMEHVCVSSKVWDRLQERFSGERERRLAYLLFHCGLEPSEIVKDFLQEWSDVHEVARLRRTILERFMQRPNDEAK